MTQCHSEQGKGRKVWKAGIYWGGITKRDGAAVFAHYGHLTPCGQWVDGNGVRWPRTPEWLDTEAEAKASMAPEIAEVGARLIMQAGGLLAAVENMADPGHKGPTASAPGMPQPAVGETPAATDTACLP